MRVFNIISRISSEIELNRISGDKFLRVKTAQSVVILGVSLLLNLVTNLAFTRLYGAEVYGQYAYIISVVLILAVFALLGTDTLIIREIATAKENNSGILTWAKKRMAWLSLVFTLLPAFFVYLFHMEVQLPLWPTIAALLLIPVIAFLRLYTAVLQGKKKVISAQLPERILRTFGFLLFLLLFYFLSSGGNNALLPLIILNLVAFIFALIYASFKAKKSRVTVADNKKEDKISRVYWNKSSVQLFWISIIIILNSRIDILMLGGLTNSENVGIYNIACRLSEIIAFSLLVVNFPLSPLISELFINKEFKKLQSVIKGGGRLAFLMSMPLFLLFVVFSDRVLSVFGEGFEAASSALIILCVAQFVNVLVGSVNKILTMTGFEKDAVRSLVVSVIVNIALNLYLIPKMGIDGAAYATAAAMVMWNVLMLYYVVKRIGVNPTILAFKIKR